MPKTRLEILYEQNIEILNNLNNHPDVRGVYEKCLERYRAMQPNTVAHERERLTKKSMASKLQFSFNDMKIILETLAYHLSKKRQIPISPEIEWDNIQYELARRVFTDKEMRSCLPQLIPPYLKL